MKENTRKRKILESFKFKNLQLNFFYFRGERGSRTYEIIEFHKISIYCKLSVYKIVKFIETHRVHFDI